MRLRLLTIGGVLCVLGLAITAGVIAAQGGGEGGGYLGAGECSACHRGLARDHAATAHALTLQSPETEGAIVADFTQGEDQRTLQFPGESAARPITAEDIAIVIGAGKHAQRYAVEVDGALVVVPIEWNTAAGQWQPFTLAESWPDPAYDFATNCAYCHTAGFDSETQTWIDDGVQCEACHGPGEAHVSLADEAGNRPSDEETDAIRAAIFNRPDSQMCGQCHNRGTDTATGRVYPTAYRPGGDLLAGYTPIASGDATHWWAAGHASQPNMQYNEWLESAHARALEGLRTSEGAQDSCLSCHSGDYRYIERIRGWFDEYDLDGTKPESLTLATAEFGIACQTCHNPHSEEDYPFYLVAEPYALCAECHNTADFTGEGIHHPTLELYEGRPIVEEVEGTPSGHFATEGGPDCLTCHMPRLAVAEGDRASHALRAVLPDAPEALTSAVGCVSCHTDVTSPQVQAMITDARTDLAARLEAAQAALGADSPAWVRTAVAAVAGDSSSGLHNYGYTNALLSAAETELGLRVPVEVVIPEAPPEPEWILLPLIGRVENMTTVGLTMGTLAFLAALTVGLGLVIHRAGRQRLLGWLLVLVALALLVIAVVLVLRSGQKAQAMASGEDSYCLMCHSGSARPLTLADGHTLRLAIDPAGMETSVHGTASEIGYVGCIDCHGADAFPHHGVPQSLRQYRVERSLLCVDCHVEDIQHYRDVRKNNIPVGCADCHGAHAVQPADTLRIAPTRVIEGIEAEVTPAPAEATGE